MNRRRWWLVGAVTVLTCALGVGCTPDPDPEPTPSSSPTAASPSVTPIPTPPETDLEREQRLDYEAAETVYRRFRAEYRRVLRAGGAKQATKVMKETAGNGYLQETEDVVVGYKKIGVREKGRETIVYVRYVGWQPKTVNLNVCEDDRSVEALNEDGKSIGPGEFRAVSIEVRQFRSGWKLWSGDGKKVEQCE